MRSKALDRLQKVSLFCSQDTKALFPQNIRMGKNSLHFCSDQVGDTRIISQQEVLGEGSYNGLSGHTAALFRIFWILVGW